MYNLEVQGNHDFFVGDKSWLVHNAEISLQQKGGFADSDMKGFHFQYGKGEFALRPTLLSDGTIELRIDAVGKKGFPLPSVKEVGRM